MRRLLLSILAALVVLPMLAGLALTGFLRSERAKAWVEAQGVERFGVPVTLGELSPSLSLSPSVGVRHLRFGSAPGVLEPSLLQVERARIYFDLAELLFERRFWVDRMEARHGSLTLRLDPPEADAPAEPIDLATVAGRMPDVVELEDIRLELLAPDSQPFEIAVESATLRGCEQPFVLRGRVNLAQVTFTGILGCPTGAALEIRDFEGLVSDSDVRGTLHLQSGPPRWRVTADIESGHLDTDDLRALIEEPGADGAAANGNPLDRPLPWDTLDDVDLDVQIAAQTLELGDRAISDAELELLLEDLHLDVRLQQGEIFDAPLIAELELIGNREPNEVHLVAVTDDASIAALEGVDATGSFDLKIDWSGSGRTPREVLAGLSGTLEFKLEPTRYREAPVGLLGRDVFSLLFQQATPEERGLIHCAVVMAHAVDGLARVGLVVDLPQSTVGGAGAIDLRKLEAEVLLRPASKRPSLAALNTPIRIHGPLEHLQAQLDRKAVATEAGVIVALGVAFLPLAIVPLVDLGSGDADACKEALAKADPDSVRRHGTLGRSAKAAGGTGRWLRQRLRR